MFRFRLIAALSFLCCSVALASEPYRLETFSSPDPLCSVSVPNILQDSKGFIWFGTQGGIDRYDGYRLTHIRFPDELSSFDNVRSFCEDDSGNIWICSAKGVCVWSRNTEQVSKFFSGDVSNIVKSRDGTLWVAAYHAGFLKINPVTGQCDTLIQRDKPKARYFGKIVQYNGDDAILMLNGRGEILKCRTDSDTFEIIAPSENSPLPSLDATSFQYIDGLLIGGKRGQAEGWVFDTGTKRFSTHSLGYIYGGATAPEGKQLLITSNGLEYFPEGLRRCVETGVWNGKLLVDSRVLSVCIDRDGLFWLGTKEDGVLCLAPNNARFETVVDGLSISAIEEGKDGSVWIGTTGGGLLRYRPEDNATERIKLPFENISGLGYIGDKLAVASTSAELPLVLLDADGRIEKVISDVPQNLFHLKEYGPGLIWMGGRLQSFDLKTRVIKRIEQVRTVVRDIVKDQKGRNWVATSFGGVWMEDGGKWKYYSDSAGVAMHTTALHSDGKYIWVTSPNDGLQRLDPETGEIRSYQEFGGVPCHRITGIAADAEGSLWLAASNGFAILDPSSGHTAMYTTPNGPESRQYVFSIIKFIGGRMYIGSHKGLMSFDPALFKASNIGRGRIVFTEYSRLKPMEMADRGKPEQLPDIDKQSFIKLRANENSFVLGCSQMDYSIPMASSLEFCLTGYADQWRAVDKGQITIVGLSTGQHKLSVRLVERASGRILDSRTLNISVASPLLLSWPAFAIYILLLVGVVILTVSYTQRLAFRKAEENARKEAELREAESQKQLYASKVEFLTTIAHEIRTPLTLVKAPVETLQRKLANTADKSVLEELEVVESNAGRLSDLLNDLLDFRKLENSGISLNPAEYDITALVRSVAGRFTLAARRRQLDFSVDLPEKVLNASVDKNALDKIISNLLSNAIKYASGYVRLRMDFNSRRFRIVTENDGAVVPLADRERIFRPFERFVPQGSVESGTGIGLFVSRNLAELHKGTLSMDKDSSLNRFELVIPVVHIADETAAIELPDIHIPQARPTLLIVEDNEEMLGFISRQFVQQYAVLTASNGAEALKLIKDNPLNAPDCIISDVVMPLMDGYEFCRAVKADKYTAHIPVILLTALGDQDSKLSGLEDGADAYVSKPFSPEELLVLVSNILKNRERVRNQYQAASALESRRGMIADSADAQLLRTVDEYIHTHLTDEALSVESLAAAACVSVTTLFKKMKQLIDMAPSEYILLVRLQQASLLLKNSTVPIAEIAGRTGFSSPSYFAYRFKAQFGMTPKEYRRKTDS